MKGDFSRLTFDSSKHYERVLMQQGRVQLDADWNEQQEILAHRLETEIEDLIGPSGAPAHAAGFKITPSYALEFDGVDDYILLSPPAALLRARYPAFTIELRVQVRSPRAGGTLISSLGFGEAGEYALVIEDDGTLTFRVLEGQVGGAAPRVQDAAEPALTPAPDVQVVDVRTTRTIPTDRFCHVAVTVAGGEALIYLDGQIVARRAGLAADYRARLPLVIGAAFPHGRGGDHVGGVIEEVRFWSIARTREEILANRERAVAPSAPNLAGYWPLDEGRGTTTLDRTANHSDGLLGGGVAECSPRWSFRDLAIGAGRYYVHGVLCENEATTLFTRQPDAPGLGLPAPASSGWFLVYLDVWKRHLTALEDPSVREVGLGGPDTATRLKTVWQARLLPVSVDGEAPDDAALSRAWDAFLRRATVTGLLRARRTHSAPSLGNLLYRVEVHDGNRDADPASWTDGAEPARARVVQVFPGANEVRVDPWDGAGLPWKVGQVVAFEGDDAGSDGAGEDAAPLALARIVDIDVERQVLGLSQLPDSDRLGRATYLRRVATFKWSRENGSVAFPVAKVDAAGGVVTLGHSSQGDLALRPGDWVELTDDVLALQQRAGPLALITAVDRSRGEVVLDGPLPNDVGQDSARHPILRRWDQGASGEALIGGALAATGSAWIALENGIEVSFEERGLFQAGDYWMIPARTATEEIEWPSDAAGPLPQAPRGIQHRYCLLAAVRFHQGHLHVRDLRQIFSSLIALEASEEGKDDDSSGDDGDDWRPDDPPIPVEVGNPVPPGFAILGPTPDPPRDYRYTGQQLLLFGAQRRATVPMRNLGRLHCAVLDHRIFLVADSGEVWEYDPRSGAVEPRAFLRPARYGFGLAVARGRLFVFGGVDLDGRLADRTSEYEPSADRWVNRMPMRAPRCHLAAATVGGKIFALGGETASWLGRRASRLNEEYDPERDRWSEWRPLPIARTALAAAAVDGMVYAIGGEQRRFLRWFGTRKLRVTEQYDPKADRWQRRAALVTPRGGLMVTRLDGKLYATGGAHQTHPGPTARGSDVVEEYDPLIDCWQSCEAVALPRHLFGLATVRNEIYAVGKEAPDQMTALIESIGRALYLQQSELVVAPVAVVVEEAVHA